MPSLQPRATIQVHNLSMQSDEELGTVADALERLAVWLRAATAGPVSATTMTALDTLARVGAMRVSDLAASEGITQPGMTALVNRLTDSGWAQKLPDPSDGRATLVRITDAGREALAGRRRERAAVLLAAIRGLEPGEQQALIGARDAVSALVRLPIRELRTGVCL